MTPPNYNAKWHVGIRGKDGKLMASITAVPVTVFVEGVKIEMGEVNFLCVHKTLREKKLSPTLIKEITRRVNLKDKWQAVTSPLFSSIPQVRCSPLHSAKRHTGIDL